MVETTFDATNPSHLQSCAANDASAAVAAQQSICVVQPADICDIIGCQNASEPRRIAKAMVGAPYEQAHSGTPTSSNLTPLTGSTSAQCKSAPRHASLSKKNLEIRCPSPSCDKDDNIQYIRRYLNTYHKGVANDGSVDYCAATGPLHLSRLSHRIFYEHGEFLPLVASQAPVGQVLRSLPDVYISTKPTVLRTPSDQFVACRAVSCFVRRH